MAAPISTTLESLNRLLKENNLTVPAANYDRNLAENVQLLLEKLSVFLRESECRALLQPLDFENLKQTFGFFTEFLHEENPDIVGLLTECVRCLRNACVQLPRNQDALLRLNIMSVIVKCITTLQEATGRCRSEELLSCLRCTVQFMGNYVTGNEATQQEVWLIVFPKIFKFLLASQDDKTCDYACMLLHNCLTKEHQEELTTSSKGAALIEEILQFCGKVSDHVWGILVVEKLVETSDTFGEAYPKLCLRSKLTLMSLLCAHLSQKSCDEQEAVTAHSSSQVEGTKESKQLSLTLNLQNSLATEFEDSAHSLLTFTTANKEAADISENEQSAWLVVKVLETLCATTSCHNWDNRGQSLRDRSSLLETVIDLLHATHRLGESGCQAFAISHKLRKEAADPAEVHPAHGFKRDLIRLIGNMSYRHPANQNKVRDLDGIPLVLDHCIIDENNPFIQQWAILAIRNLCESNPENQAVIVAMEKRGEKKVTIEQDGILKFKTTKKT